MPIVQPSHLEKHIRLDQNCLPGFKVVVDFLQQFLLC